jgi:protein TonB
MPFYSALLLSLALHAALVVAPDWFADATDRKERRLSATLMPTSRDRPVVSAPLDEIVSQTPQAPGTSRSDRSQESHASAVRRAQRALSKHLFYPPEAVAQGLEGKVTLLLILDPQGRVLSVDVARSSGHEILDQAAQTYALRIAALPGSPHQLLVPVEFRLQ